MGLLIKAIAAANQMHPILYLLRGWILHKPNPTAASQTTK
jgi:hypothetical protein